MNTRHFLRTTLNQVGTSASVFELSVTIGPHQSYEFLGLQRSIVKCSYLSEMLWWLLGRALKSAARLSYLKKSPEKHNDIKLTQWTGSSLQS